jgi:hypothetical protein
MTEIIIDGFLPGSGGVPTASSDVGNAIFYTSWDLLDEGRFNFRVPATWTGASTINLRMLEATPGTTKAHKWQAVMQLIRPGVNTTSADFETETFTAQYTSSATANQVTTREFSVSTGSSVSGVEVQAGDLISVALSRIAASSNEDSNAIKLLDLVVSFTQTAREDASGCLGRVGTIINDVLSLFNDRQKGMVTSADILGWINRCQQDLAMRGYWKNVFAVDVTAGDEEYVLADEISGCQKVHKIFWASTGDQIPALASRERFEQVRAIQSGNGQPVAWFVENGRLLLVPAPEATTSGALRVLASYVPDDMGCDSYYTPATPPAHDMLYVYFARWMAALMDRYAPNAAQEAMEYKNLYEQEVGKLMSSELITGFVLRKG